MATDAPQYSTGKLWFDPSDDLIIDWHCCEPEGRLRLVLNLKAIREGALETSLQTKGRWRVNGNVYETTCTQVLPQEGQMLVWAIVGD